jgi:hypothetical protein
MEDAIAILGKDDDVLAGVRQELSSPASPAHRLTPSNLLLTWDPLGGPKANNNRVKRTCTCAARAVFCRDA